MKNFWMPIRKRWGNETVVSINAYKTVLATEIEVTTDSGKKGTWLLCEAPEWLRNIIKINEHNFVEMNSGDE